MKSLFRAALVSVAAAALVGVATPASAITTDASITLGSTVTMTATNLKICAKITFTSAFIPNSTLSLDVTGAETWNLTEVKEIVGAPTQTDFAATQTVCFEQAIHAGSSVHVDYTVEGVGLAPTPFFGSCAGTISRINGGSNLVIPTC